MGLEGSPALKMHGQKNSNTVQRCNYDESFLPAFLPEAYAPVFPLCTGTILRFVTPHAGEFGVEESIVYCEKNYHLKFKQGVALTGRNTTDPPCSVTVKL